MTKTQLQKHITKTVNRLLYRLNNETAGGDIGNRYMKLLKEQARSDCKFFESGTVATQSKFFFLSHLIDAMERDWCYTSKSVIHIVPQAIYAESIYLNYPGIVNETLEKMQFPIEEFQKYSYRELYCE
jgi:hypothetical protein